LERKWINAADKSILDSQIKFDEISNKVAKALKNTGGFLNDLAGNEPIALPHTLWFGILDLAQQLIQKSTQTASYGLCYYLAIESLNKSPSSFIQFKAIELLLHLYNIDNKMFSMIEIDFDQYTQKLNENNSSEKFRSLLTFVKEKCFEDLKILSNDTGKGKERTGKSSNQNLKREQSNILDAIADEITCPISSEPTNQLCILKCQHILSLNNLKKLKQKICPNCREKIEDNDIRNLPQNSIYNNLYTKFFDSGYILSSFESENSSQIMDNQYDSDDSNNSEVDIILTKKNKFKNSIIKLNSSISLSSILPRITKKQHPTYQNIIKEINEKYYEKAETLCKEFLNFFPKSYSLRCLLAYIYRCLNNYEQAHLYLKEAVNLNPKRPIAYFICGEIYFRQSKYMEATNNLVISLKCKAKINNLYIILGNSYLFDSYYNVSINNYNIALKNNPNNYLYLKNCAYIYEKRRDYLITFKLLNKLLNINEKDSLILCYYGEILCNIEQYSKAVSYFTKANIIDPENVHNLNKRAITYYILQEYDKVLLDLERVIQLDPLNSSAHYLKSLTYYTKNDINNALISFKKYTELLELLNSDDSLANIQLFHLEYLLKKNSSKDLNDMLTNINQDSNTDKSESLLLIRCKIHIELQKYHEAKVDLDSLYKLIYHNKWFSYIYLFQEHSDFWSYLYKDYKIDKYDFTGFGIVNEFSKCMYKSKKIFKFIFYIKVNNY
jgi:tetratricopeptide (TPR) repeat protein